MGAGACKAWTFISEVVDVGSKVIVEAQKLMQRLKIGPEEVEAAIQEQKKKPTPLELTKYGVKAGDSTRMLQVLQNLHDNEGTGRRTKELLKVMMEKFKTFTKSEGEFFENGNREGFALCKWAARKDEPDRYDMIFVSCLSQGIQLTDTQVMARLIMDGYVGKRTRDGQEVLYFQLDLGSSEGAF